MSSRIEDIKLIKSHKNCSWEKKQRATLGAEGFESQRNATLSRGTAIHAILHRHLLGVSTCNPPFIKSLIIRGHLVPSEADQHINTAHSGLDPNQNSEEPAVCGTLIHFYTFDSIFKGHDAGGAETQRTARAAADH